MQPARPVSVDPMRWQVHLAWLCFQCPPRKVQRGDQRHPSIDRGSHHPWGLYFARRKLESWQSLGWNVLVSLGRLLKERVKPVAVMAA